MASYYGDTEILESFKNDPLFSYKKIMADASYDGNHVHVFEWLKTTGYVFDATDIQDAICNAVCIGQTHNLRTLDWFRTNHYSVVDIILEHFGTDELSEPVLDWIKDVPGHPNK